jgi:predicted O-methyltransferase YrrM
VPADKPPSLRTRRRFDYARRLLPSSYLARLEPEELDDPQVAKRLFTGHTIGYPAWNLLYYALLCSLPGADHEKRDDVVVIETGTNRGASTIVMAQALEDVNLDAAVQTVEMNERVLELAKAHVSLAGLSEHVDFNLGDSLEFLAGVVEQQGRIDFIFLDDDHSRDHVVEEFSIIHPALMSRRGTVYFDNTTEGDVAEALETIKAEYGGNLVRFDNCSWSPPGNAIWQPD